jgi:hypothetical protein
LADSGLLADVSGQVSLPAGSQAATLVWVVAVAYDAQGWVVGVRRWENTAPLQPGESLTFQLQVASLGAPIAEVHFLVEARP